MVKTPSNIQVTIITAKSWELAHGPVSFEGVKYVCIAESRQHAISQATAL